MIEKDALEIWLPVVRMGVESMPELLESVDMATEALKQISAIKQIISDSTYIQEDVIRYKMICEVLEDKK